MVELKNFMVVDDDNTNNIICEYIIKQYNDKAEIRTFIDPREALQLIRENRGYEGDVTIIFLDINMPIMSGFEFLDIFRDFGKAVIEQYHIYMLTSSIEDFSSKAGQYPMVKSFLSKPFKLSHLQNIQLELAKDNINTTAAQIE